MLTTSLILESQTMNSGIVLEEAEYELLLEGFIDQVKGIIAKLKSGKKVSDDEIKTLEKYGQQSLVTVAKNPKKYSSSLKKLADELGHVEDEKEMSNKIMVVVKAALVHIPNLTVKVITLINPVSWLLVYLIKRYALQNKITMKEAWKRLFGYEIDAMVQKWDPTYKKLFWRVMASEVLIALVKGSIPAVAAITGISGYMGIAGATFIVVALVVLYIATIYYGVKILTHQLKYGSPSAAKAETIAKKYI